MIKLSDYLNYLNNEVIQARKKADEEAIKIAKQYAEHEYLKYFRVPRFSMPSVKMNIPIKINELSSKTKFNFDRDYDSFVAEVNNKIAEVNEKKKMNIVQLDKVEMLKNKNIISVFDKLERQDYRPVKNLEDSISKIDFKNVANTFTDNIDFSTASEATQTNAEKLEYTKILTNSFRNRFTPIASQLNDIFIDPDTSKESDKGKVLLNLEVEMVEESIRIRNVKDKDGNDLEEIIFE